MDKIYYLGRRNSLLQGHDYICPPLCGQGRGDGRGGERPGTPAELETIAEICRHVPEHPARNFYEAVQAQCSFRWATGWRT